MTNLNDFDDDIADDIDDPEQEFWASNVLFALSMNDISEWKQDLEPEHNRKEATLRESFKLENNDTFAAHEVVFKHQSYPNFSYEDVEKEMNNETRSMAEFCLERHDDSAICAQRFTPTGTIQSFTYGELKRSARHYANRFVEMIPGLQKGDKVLLCCRNSWDLIVLYWAAHYLGLVAITVVPNHLERRYLMRYTCCKVLVISDEFYDSAKAEIDTQTKVQLVVRVELGGIAGGGELEEEFSCPHGVSDEYFDPIARETTPSFRVVRFQDSARSEKLSICAEGIFKSIRNMDEALWYFTSGTTGKPKGCVHGQIDLIYAGLTYGKHVMECTAETKVASSVAMAGPYAMGSNCVFPFCVGGSIFLDYGILPKTGCNGVFAAALQSDRGACYHSQKAGLILTESNCQTFVSIPGDIRALTMDIRAILQGKVEMNSFTKRFIKAACECEIVTSAGSPLPSSTFENFVYVHERLVEKFGADFGIDHRHGIQLLDGIGTSEIQHIFMSNSRGDVHSNIMCIGTVCPGYEIALMNVEYVPDPNGDPDVKCLKGELCVRTVFPGIQVQYSNQRPPKGTDYDAATEGVIFPSSTGNPGNDWYITGDLAMAKSINEVEHFFLLGRTGDRDDLQSQIKGEARGLGIEDYRMIQNVSDIVSEGGSFRMMEEINKELQLSDFTNPLVMDCFAFQALIDPSSVQKILSTDPQVEAKKTTIFIVAVTTSHWNENKIKYGFAKTLLVWADFLCEQIRTRKNQQLRSSNQTSLTVSTKEVEWITSKELDDKSRPRRMRSIVGESLSKTEKRENIHNTAIEVPHLNIIFIDEKKIPRTAPPLLKPKVGEMKKRVKYTLEKSGRSFEDADTLCMLSADEAFF